MSKYIIGDIFEGDFPITQYYNENPQIYTMFQIPGHEGVDWGTPNGTPVIAPFDGIILRDTIADKAYGNFCVVWDPKQQCALWYCHLQDFTTQPGDRVVKGQLLGHTNNTGNSTGPHLHVDFVETDELGNRLNRDNGKQGFLDIMDSDLVEWKLGNDPEPTPQPVIETPAVEPTPEPVQPAPEVVVTPTETEIPITVTTSSTGSTQVDIPVTTTSTQPIEMTSSTYTQVLSQEQQTIQPPIEAKPLPETKPTLAPWRLSDLIVWILVNIKSTLLNIWKDLSQK